MKRILISDDDPHVIRVLRLALERKGYEIDSVPNGEEALKYINEDSPDVLITDITMPRMDGRELCRRIQRDYPERNFLILVMTSRTERENREWVKEIEKIEFLEKPLSPMRLIARLKEYFKDSGSGDMHE
jgi:CheY-like chemotaxis protein